MIRKARYRILGNFYKGNSVELFEEVGHLREGNKLLVVEVVDGILHCIDKSKNKVQLKLSDRGIKFEALQDASEFDFTFIKNEAEKLIVEDGDISLSEITEEFDENDKHSLRMIAVEFNDEEWFNSIK